MRVKKEELFDIILNEIKENKKVTEKYLANKYNYSERTIRRYIKILKDTNKISMANTGVEKYWIIND